MKLDPAKNGWDHAKQREGQRGEREVNEEGNQLKY